MQMPPHMLRLYQYLQSSSAVHFNSSPKSEPQAVILRRMWKELVFATRCISTSKRLKSEVHKLPRSQSNLKLATSVSNNMSLLESNAPTQTRRTDVNHSNSHDQLLQPESAERLAYRPYDGQTSTSRMASTGKNDPSLSPALNPSTETDFLWAPNLQNDVTRQNEFSNNVEPRKYW